MFEEIMEHQFVLAAVATTIAIASIFLLFYRRSDNGTLPPSPKGALPVIGHLHLLGQLPHQSLFKLSKTCGGFMYLKLGSIGTLVVSTTEAARQLFMTQDLVFASRPANSLASKYPGFNGKDLVFAPHGNHWRNLRKICTLEIFTLKRVEAFRPLRELEREIAITKISEACRKNEAVNLTDSTHDWTFNSMVRILTGSCISQDDRKAAPLKEAIVELVQHANGTGVSNFFPYLRWFDRQAFRLKRVTEKLSVYIVEQIEEHRKNWRAEQAPKDFIDVMLSTGELDNTSMKALLLDLVLAGVDTSAVTVQWAVSELINHPDWMRQAQEELDTVIGRERSLTESDVPQLKILHAVVKETLRLHPPGPLLVPHESTQDTVLDGHRVPAKTWLLVNAHAIGRDAAVWSRAEEFDPHRFLPGGAASTVDLKGQHYELLPFGTGRRMCPAVTLGLTMVYTMLGSLIQNFDWTLPCGEKLDMEEEYGITVPRKIPLVLLPSARLRNYDSR